MFMTPQQWSRPLAVQGRAPIVLHTVRPAPLPIPAPRVGKLADLYHRLVQGTPDAGLREKAAVLLRQQIALVANLPCDLPESPPDLNDWMRGHAELTTTQYKAYLKARQAGGTRRYFYNRAHAFYFLRAVAPTKLADGAWLYGLLPHRQNPRFADLIRTYVEELGEGAADKNHVLLYRQLLSGYGLDMGAEAAGELDDAFYIQGLIQLALACHAEDFLPELIGFNLGYEQLPLHLLISAYELGELGLDPYYFTLHVTVDNADTGHARRAVQAVLDLLPRVGDSAEFWRRLRLGYQLSEAGVGSTDVIAGFDIEREILRVFSRKRAYGHGAHSDFCRVAGRSVNDWLADPAQVASFLAALQQTGWIKRGEAVAESRFWSLLQGERASMFGVFSGYELQLIHDWIRGPASADAQAYAEPSAAPSSSHPARFRAAVPHIAHRGARPASVTQHKELLDPDLQALQQQLATLDGDQHEARLIELMSPSQHWTPAGLHATRLFCERLVSSH